MGYVTASKVAPFDLAKYSYYFYNCIARALCGGGRAQLSRRTCGTSKCIGVGRFRCLRKIIILPPTLRGAAMLLL